MSKLKFQNERFISDLFIDQVAENVSSFGKFEQIGWISSGKLAHRSRPYQPVADVAKAVGKKLKIPVSADITKIKNRKQSGANYQSRFFDLPQSLRLTESPKQITYYLLLEDVVTTGATANESARLLKQSGIKEVHVISLFQRERE
ncbi:MAG: ComF family protein [Leptonema sp. (in: Bacteria)]|nr:ComF family protein [Leptonema sp. (in: bacteria)]